MPRWIVFVCLSLVTSAFSPATADEGMWLLDNFPSDRVEKAYGFRPDQFMCRERALLDSERKVFWLAKAEEWGQCALDEIAFHFRECNLDITDSQKATS